MKKTKFSDLRPFDAAEYLDNEETIEEYLKACAEENDPVLLMRALGAVARARGMTKIARETGLSRESLYRAFSQGGNPQFDTVAKVARALDLEVTFRSSRPSTRSKHAAPLRSVRRRKGVDHVAQ